jgi:hypothetical protein
MPLYALIDGNRLLAEKDGPRRASCAECGHEMIARTGSIVIWHWAHRVRNPDCETAPESEWHLAWKALALDGTQEVKVGRRRADVLAPGGFAVEFQASALTAEEVRAREDDWAAQGGMAWVFKADTEYAAGRIKLKGSLAEYGDDLVKPENRATLDITWAHAPERVRAARAPSFLDIGDDQLLFIGGWPDPDWYPLEGYGWRVSKDWLVQNLLRGSTLPSPLADNPAVVRRKIMQYQWREGERQRHQYIEAELQRRERRDWLFVRRSLDQVEHALKTGHRPPAGSPAAAWRSELWPLRDDIRAVRAIWAAAVRASGGKLPTEAAVRRARQEYEQEMRDRDKS